MVYEVGLPKFRFGERLPFIRSKVIFCIVEGNL